MEKQKQKNERKNKLKKCQINKILAFCIVLKLVKKTLKFEVEVNKKEIHVSKKPIALSLLNVNQILKSDKI